MSLIKYFLTVVLTAVPLCFATEIHAQQSDEYFGETYLFFDTETTGLPLDHKLPSTDTANWPRLVQVGWILANDEGVELSSGNFIVYPNGFEIPKEASKIHGFTTEIARNNGLPLDSVINLFLKDFKKADCIVGHNVSFDQKVMGAEFIRLGRNDPMFTKRAICTMHGGTEYCQLKGKYGKYKWPKLQELYYKLFGTNFEDAHDAMADIRATARCFWKMKELGIF